MKRIIVILTSFLALFGSAYAGTVSGRVHSGRSGIPGVVVSDGFNTTLTDAKGNYELKTDKSFGYVFISVPSGFKVPLKGARPQFYKYTSKASGLDEKIDFSLKQDPGQEKHIMLAFADFHLADINNDRQQLKTWAKDVRKFVADHKDTKVYACTLGDMSWDLYWVSEGYNIENYAKDIDSQVSGIPVFQVIGNHDHEIEAKGEFNATRRYRRTLGPTYYSFNIGNVHYVALDAVNSQNDGKGSRKYECRVVKEQMTWLKEDLSYVSPDRQIVVLTHIPLATIVNGSDLLDCFAKFERPVHFMTAHFHSIANVDNTTAARGVRYYDHMCGCVGGSLWLTGYNCPGMDLCKDGAPNGYMVIYNSPEDISWQYKGTGKPLDFQFRTYDGNCIDLAPESVIPQACKANVKFYGTISKEWQKKGNNYVYINIWDMDTSWKVEVSENGKMLPVERISLHDPLHILCYPVKVLNTAEDMGKIPQPTKKASHFVRVKASAPDTTLEIKVTDRFGNVYTESMARPKAFTLENYY